jgi:hypothetical protein
MTGPTPLRADQRWAATIGLGCFALVQVLGAIDGTYAGGSWSAAGAAVAAAILIPRVHRTTPLTSREWWGVRACALVYAIGATLAAWRTPDLIRIVGATSAILLLGSSLFMPPARRATS